MSGLFLLGLIALWLFVGWLIYLFWRSLSSKNGDKLSGKVIHAVIGLALFSAWFGGGFWATAGKKAYYDAQVRKMCAKDGGIEVYETVTLPPSRFDKYGNIGVRVKRNAKTTDEYYYEMDETVLRKENPTLVRSTSKLIRRSDNKILGMQISYGRGG